MKSNTNANKKHIFQENS